MQKRALVISVLLASPAWSQEPVDLTPAVAPSSFDLTNDAIKKIVHDTAALQSSPVLISSDAGLDADTEPTVRWIPPEQPPMVKEIAPRPSAAPPPVEDDLVSTLVDIALDSAVDSLLGDRTDDALREQQYKEWPACHAQDKPATTAEPYGTCRVPPLPR